MQEKHVYKFIGIVRVGLEVTTIGQLLDGQREKHVQARTRRHAAWLFVKRLAEKKGIHPRHVDITHANVCRLEKEGSSSKMIFVTGMGLQPF